MHTIPKFSDPIYVTKPLLPAAADMHAKIDEIWSSGWLTNGGRQHRQLEDRLRTFLNVQHISLFNNGTNALLTACQALRLQGEVITTPFTFPATPHTLFWNNLTPVFCDISYEDMTIDPNAIEGLITGRTSAISAVHVYGMPCNVKAIEAIAKRHGLKVVYDAAHAFGTLIDGVPITKFGDISMLSFHATKLFQTAEGGALVAQEFEIKQRIDYLKNFGIKDEDTVLMPGTNGKMNEIQAALGLLVLDLVRGEQARRAELRQIYEERLNRLPGIKCVKVPDNVQSSEQYLVIRVTSDSPVSRDRLHLILRDWNVFARKYFFPLCSEYSCYRMLPSSIPERLPTAHKVVSEVLCLPFFSTLGRQGVERICDIIESIVAK